jgi:peptidoglycan/LPS O-acetylase OafA/YrhL
MHKIENVQILRAIAALLVAFGHFEGSAREKMGYVRSIIPTGSGVDLFFIVSGFVMFLTIKKFQGRGFQGSADFFVRRLIRIVPLYWTCIAMYLAVNMISGHSVFTIEHILASLFFIPFDASGTGGGSYFPVFDLGWTLNYEMYYYVLFSLGLVISAARPVLGVITLLILSVCMGAFIPRSDVQLYFWTRPIILEFAIGMMIAQAFVAGIRLTSYLALAGIILSVGLLATNATAFLISSEGGTTLNDFGRVMGWGVPMGILFSAVVLMRKQVAAHPIVRPFMMIGDASYSLYLLHPFVLIFLWQIWMRIPFASEYPALYVVVGLSSSTILALLSYSYFEKPVLQALNLTLPRRAEQKA